ncbi:N-acetyl-gamma-glutamyl-phosphate reductase [Desulfoplanes formicivorans]|uniref:N-acetyl-gamma-glutamyl-phosphate reductase n=1 Tax=Desulfoplanes formicivorans TaxID=1592317 RepID=A0A194AEM9_9BACT|nr:N-acetyl-gamma-glutamyl-phosphate reductase [Desulfoplanes formicivorans]GAU08532.1 N-acetyl-gamma-glutamyl-phosphate reductase [Desulfoplanes formicivorans]
MEQYIKTGLVGATGYTGMELARLMIGHPVFKLVLATSRKEAGKTLVDIFPHLQATILADVPLVSPDPDVLAKECDLVFLAVPHGTAMNIAAELLARKVRVIDLSADFRLHDAGVYEAWYNVTHTQQQLLSQAVYGLPELYAQDIAHAELIANPGCYPTSAILGLYPALQQGLIKTEDIVVDSKSGATGAGRKASVSSLFCEVNENFRAYNLGQHRHTPEIEQEVSVAASTPVTLSFNTHLVPIDRGILSTIYTRLNQPATLTAVHDLFTRFYAHKSWVRVLPQGALPQTKWVRGTMFCDIGLAVDPRTDRLIIVTAIDNLCRGASGQALANANIMFGLDQTLGLHGGTLIP